MLQKLTRLLKEFGFFAGLLYTIDRVLAAISPSLRLYFYEIMVQPIPEEPLIPARLTKNLEIREIKRGDPEVDLMPARADIKEARFRQNAICLGAFQKGRFIGYMWFCSYAYEEDEVRCTFLLSPVDEAVFDFDFYLFPEHRMGLGFIGMWSGANKFLNNRGIKYTFSRLTRFNLASRRAHNHLGWKCIGRTLFLQAWRLQVMVATIFPYFHLSFSKSGRVQLKLCPDALLMR
ncbi:MAG: hypothetical protein ABIT23_06015 [Nitrosospira sp.]